MKCPVCEHEQVFGVECEVCGKELGGIGDLGPPPVTVERVEGLELTSAAPIGEVPVERVGELEVTRYDAVAVVAERTADVEHTSVAAVGEVAVERVADLAQDRAPDDGQRTALPTGPVPCRYCRHVQASGTICERCGMKLPVVAVPAAIMGTIVGGTPLEAKVRCRSCGAPAKAGERCGDCGREVPFPDA